MPRARPQLSITLPKNFTLNTSHNEEVKTPDGFNGLPPLQRPPTNNLYRLKRRARPAISSLFSTTDESLSHPLESPFSSDQDPASDQRPVGLDRHFNSLSAVTGASRPHVPRSPHTPEPQQIPATTPVSIAHDRGGLLSRPLSACSIFSDSSDDSGQSLASCPPGDGSCTSPESDAPIRRHSVNRKKCRSKHSNYEPILKSWHPSRLTSESEMWTEEMDWHLWSTYLRYLQDPTMTPFKMLPGIAPPLGVCYRVAREARKSWTATKHRKSTQTYLHSPVSSRGQGQIENDLEAPGTPFTIRRILDENVTPTAVLRAPSLRQWPKSGSSTRRRLRHLCKNRPSIAPHYQRLLQSRTPSPFSSSQSSNVNSRSQLSEVSSPQYESLATFSTRDVQLSLSTSTADTMQPDGPLAQLASNPAAFQKRDFEDFNEPPVPFASDISAPSEMELSSSPPCGSNTISLVPRLGSPFTCHTWGPSHTKPRSRPRVERNYVSDLATIRPAHGSGMQLIKDDHTPSLHKRRAIHHLGGSMPQQGRNIMENFTAHQPEAHGQSFRQRPGSRGPRLGESQQHPLQSLFDTPVNTYKSKRSLDVPMASLDSDTQTDLDRKSSPIDPSLDSPFQAAAPRRVRKALQLVSPPGLPIAGEHHDDSQSTKD